VNQLPHRVPAVDNKVVPVDLLVSSDVGYVEAGAMSSTSSTILLLYATSLVLLKKTQRIDRMGRLHNCKIAMCLLRFYRYLLSEEWVDLR
jgi:hypothetical protein